jgi:tetratricopeptide (TPR) repeat protein
VQLTELEFRSLASEALLAVNRFLSSDFVVQGSVLWETMYEPLTHRGEYALVVDVARKVLAASAAEDLLAAEVRARWLCRIGYCERILGDLKSAITSITEALELDRSSNNRAGEARDLIDLGRCSRTARDFVSAIGYFDAAGQIYRDMGDLSRETIPRGLAGFCRAISMKQPQLAIEEDLEPALKAHQAAGRTEFIASTLSDLGYCYRSLGDYARALDYHQQALSIERSQHRLAGEAIQLSSIGICHELIGDLARSVRFFESALAIHSAVRHLEGQSVQLTHLARCYEQLGAREQARRCRQQVETIERRLSVADAGLS